MKRLFLLTKFGDVILTLSSYSAEKIKKNKKEGQKKKSI